MGCGAGGGTIVFEELVPPQPQSVARPSSNTAKRKRNRRVANCCRNRRETNAESPAASQTSNGVVDHSGSGNCGESGIIADCGAEVSVSVVNVGLAPGVTEGGLNDALTPEGNPEAPNIITLAKPLASLGATVTGIATDFPDESVTEADGTEMAKSSSVKGIAAEGPPPGARLVTVTPPAVPTAGAEIEAVSWVELTKLVGWGWPPKFTVEVGRKLEPLTVSTKAVPTGAFAGESDEIAGTGLSTAAETSVEFGLSPEASIAETT